MKKKIPQIKLYGQIERDLIVGDKKTIAQTKIVNLILSMSLNFKQTHLKKNNAINIETIEFKPLIKSIDKNLFIKDIINQKTGEFLVCKPVSPYPKPFHVSKKLYLKLSAIFK